MTGVYPAQGTSESPRALRETAAKRLREAGVDAFELEAQRIVDEVGDDAGAVGEIVERRIAGEPLGVILGRVTFMGIPVQVAPGTLTPREETELLGRTAVETLGAMGVESPAVIDMCCGVGNLAVAIASHVETARVFASDLTGPCVESARRNAGFLGLEGRVRVVQGDLFAPLVGMGLEHAVDLIVCNPPYISTKRLEGDRRHLLDHEPREAFDAGPYGLTIHQRVVTAAPEFLKPGGWLMFEFGEGQGKQVKILFDRSRKYSDFRLVCDASGTERVAVGRLNSGEVR